MTDDRTVHIRERREELLTVKQYADLFGLHIQTVYSAIRRGHLPYRVIRGTLSRRAPIRIVFHVEA